MISLITMSQGNVKALKKTLDSFKGIVDEVIYGDLLLFEDDRNVVREYEQEYNLRSFRYPFNYIFKEGFSSILNSLAEKAKNDIVVYMNVGEVVDEDYGMKRIIEDNYWCNTFFLTHRTESHRWYRCYNKKELKWSGNIHEEVQGEHRPYHKPIIMFADLDKDMDDPFKAKVFDSVKEAVYFKQYLRLVDDPSSRGGTNEGWVSFARDNYDSMKGRMLKKGKLYEALVEGDFEMFMWEIYNGIAFKDERLQSTHMIEFQGDPKFLGK